MRTMVVRWGNSQGVRLPKALLETASLRVGDAVTLEADEEGIRIRKAGRRHRSLSERLAGYEGAYRAEEWETGSAAGKEEG